MKKLCSYCQEVIEPGAPDAPPDAPVSHGICSKCLKRLQENPQRTAQLESELVHSLDYLIRRI